MTAVSDTAKDAAAHADEHAHETRPRYDDVNVSVVVMVGVISVIVTMLTIWFVQGLTYQWENSYIRERSWEYANTPAKQVIEDQKKLLAGDPQAGIIPIDEAIKKVVATYGQAANNGAEAEGDHVHEGESHDEAHSESAGH